MTAPASPERPARQHPVQDRSLGFLLREVYALLQDDVYEAVAAAGHPGLRALHSSILRHLPPEGGRVADVARATGLAKQSATYVVQDLVELGYLRTESDPEDGRARRIIYTARGQKLLSALANASGDAESRLAAALGVDKVRALRGMLEAALTALPGADRPTRKARPAGKSMGRARGR